jgi:hypothetical protein
MGQMRGIVHPCGSNIPPERTTNIIEIYHAYCGSRQKYCTWSARGRGMKLGDSSELVYIELYITDDLST